MRGRKRRGEEEARLESVGTVPSPVCVCVLRGLVASHTHIFIAGP